MSDRLASLDFSVVIILKFTTTSRWPSSSWTTIRELSALTDLTVPRSSSARTGRPITSKAMPAIKATFGKRIESSQRTPLDSENASSLPLGSLVSTGIRRRRGAGCSVPSSRSRPTVELVPHRERPAVAVSEPGRSVREPTAPFSRRNETGTGGSPPLIATLLQITGNGLKQAVAVPGLVRFSTDGSPQHAHDVRRDARTRGTMNRAGSDSDAWNLT